MATDRTLAQWRALLEAATPGPWTMSVRSLMTVRGPHPKDRLGRTRLVAQAIFAQGTFITETSSNAKLIAAAPDAVRTLLRLAEAAQAVYAAWDEERPYVNKMATLGRVLRELNCVPPDDVGGAKGVKGEA